jgi:hypothetical protein
VGNHDPATGEFFKWPDLDAELSPSSNGAEAEPRPSRKAAAGATSEELTAIPLSEIEMRSIEWFEKPLWQRSAFQSLAWPTTPRGRSEHEPSGLTRCERFSASLRDGSTVVPRCTLWAADRWTAKRHGTFSR